MYQNKNKMLNVLRVQFQIPVTYKVTGGPQYVAWFVLNQNQYSAESLSVRSLILRVQMLFPQRSSTRPAYSETVFRSTGLRSFHVVNQHVLTRPLHGDGYV